MQKAASDAMDEQGGARELRFGSDGLPVLMGMQCADCGELAFPPVAVCPKCLSLEPRPVDLPRSGSLYAFTRVHVGPRKWLKPYTLGYVDLPSGPRVLARLVGTAPRIGGTVTLDVAVVGRAANGEDILDFVFRCIAEE